MAMHSAVKGKLLAVIGDEVSMVTKVVATCCVIIQDKRMGDPPFLVYKYVYFFRFWIVKIVSNT